MSLSYSLFPINYVLFLTDCKVCRQTALSAPVLPSALTTLAHESCPVIGTETGSETEPFVVTTMSTKAAKLKKAASVKIQHHIGGLRTNIPAQMCVAGPPVATQLGQLGINIQQFVKDFNLS